MLKVIFAAPRCQSDDRMVRTGHCNGDDGMVRRCGVIVGESRGKGGECH